MSKTTRFASLILGIAGMLASACAHNSKALHEREAPLVEQRDAFYDAARIGADSALLVVGKHGKILRSEDDGETWRVVPSATDRPLFSVAFTSPKQGFIVGANGLFLESSDGGLTWSQRDLGVGTQLFSIRFVSERTGFIIGEFGTLLRSEDGGKQWAQISVPWEDMLPELVETLGVVEPHLYDVVFCGSRGWAVGEYGLIIVSEDGGRSWVKQRGGDLFDRHLFAATCIGESTLVTAGQGGEILHSSDAGKEWALAEPPRQEDIYDLVYLADRGQLLAFGDLGLLLRSSDPRRPASWETVVNPRREMGYSWLAKGLPDPPHLLVVGESTLKRLPISDLAPANS